MYDKGDGCRQHPYKREQCADRKCPRLRVLGTTLQPQGKERGQRDTTKNHGRLGGIRQTPGYLQKQPCHLPEETQVYNSCVLPAMTYGAETWTLTKQAQNKLAAAQTKMEIRPFFFNYLVYGSADPIFQDLEKNKKVFFFTFFYFFFYKFSVAGPKPK